MPRICAAFFFTSSTDFATFTPPPLPRPPAWICALTTQTLPPSFLAAPTALSTENAGKPRGVARRTRAALPCPGTRGSSSRLTPIPFRVPLLHRIGGRLERVTLVELERLAAVLALFLHLAGEGLDRRGRHASEHLREMRASLGAAQNFPDFLSKILGQAQADQLAIGRRDLLAAARVRQSVHGCRRIQDGEIAVDGEAQPHLVDRLARAPHAGLQVVIVVLDVAETRLDVPQPVGALVALEAHAPRVRQLALDVLDRQWHGGGF